MPGLSKSPAESPSTATSAKGTFIQPARSRAHCDLCSGQPCAMAPDSLRSVARQRSIPTAPARRAASQRRRAKDATPMATSCSFGIAVPSESTAMPALTRFSDRSAGVVEVKRPGTTYPFLRAQSKKPWRTLSGNYLFAGTALTRVFRLHVIDGLRPCAALLVGASLTSGDHHRGPSNRRSMDGFVPENSVEMSSQIHTWKYAFHLS